MGWGEAGVQAPMRRVGSIGSYCDNQGLGTVVAVEVIMNVQLWIYSEGTVRVIYS